MKTYTLPVIGLMTLGASAFAAAAPSTGNSLPARDNFSACKWLGDRFKWFNSERDHKNPYIQEFNVSLRMQYGLDWIDPNGEGRVMGEKEGNGRRFNDEWRRFRAGFIRGPKTLSASRCAHCGRPVIGTAPCDCGGSG